MDSAVTGKKGTGKSLFCIGVIRDALLAGKRVATNMDVFLEPMFGPFSKCTYYRLPDRPTVRDFELIGRGQEGVVEDDNGVIVLDETSTIFNARTFGDRERQPMLDWLVHSRKLGWDIYYICQGLTQIDKVIRDTQIEYHIAVKRTDKWPIPFLTPFGKIFGLNIRFPRMHMGIYRQGVDVNALVVDRKFYRSKELYDCYDTQQLFVDRDSRLAQGVSMILPPILTQGRYLHNPPCRLARVFFALIGYDWLKQELDKSRQVSSARKAKSSLALDLMVLPLERRWNVWRWISENERYWQCETV